MNAADNIAEKLRLAGECRQEVDVLLDCPNHQAGCPECRACRLVATLRRQATELIRRAARVSELRGNRKFAQVRRGANQETGLRAGVASLRSGRMRQ
jgi:predicted anti-sigma-YlaC factor YlaD